MFGHLIREDYKLGIFAFFLSFIFAKTSKMDADVFFCVMLNKIAINNTIHIQFLRKYFGFFIFLSFAPPPPVF